ncbi:MAG: hypothetical protein P8X74_06585 [Reinekea sp.]
MTIKSSLILLITSISLLSCNDDGNSNKEAINSLESLAGIYNASEDYGTEGYDEFYLGFDKDGTITNYNYLGDSYDNQGNCYMIDSGGTIAHSSGNEFLADDGTIISVTKDGDTYTFQYDNKSISYKKTNLVASDLLAAKCDVPLDTDPAL